MKIEKEFEVAQPPALVWEAFSDMRLVASCVPGASIEEDLGDGRYRGRFSVKVGPLAASFDGEMTLTRDDARQVGIVEGKGADARSSSRANGTMTYRLAPEGGGTRVSVDCTMNLAGALAQFGKAAVMREIVNRITAEFARNLEAQLAARVEPAAAAGTDSAPTRVSTAARSGSSNAVPAASASAPSASASPRDPAPSLDAGGLVWSIVRDAVARFFRSLFGARRRESRKPKT